MFIPSMICYVLACYFPSFIVEGEGYPEVGGWFLSLFGWVGLVMDSSLLSLFYFSWFANVTYLFAIISLLHNRSKSFHIWMVCTFVLGMSFLFCPSVIKDESGQMFAVDSMTIGYYLWMGSFFCLWMGGLCALKR